MRLEAGVGGSRTLYDGLGFDHTMSMNLDATGTRSTGASKPGASGKYDGKYRYEGPGASESPGSSATVLGAERNSLAVKGHPVAFTTKAGSYYLGQDRLGSTESISDSAGGIFERLEYDAFGSIVSGDPEAASLWGYAGKRYDPATGSYDYGFRDYAPSQGRFTSVDPIRDGANWYGYCDADPVNFVDLWGLSASDKSTPSTKKMKIPAEGTITSSFGYREDPFTGEKRLHTGIDIANVIGTPVNAAAAGKVIETSKTQELGNYVIIAHDKYKWSADIKDYEGTTTRYYHLDSVGIKVGASVSKDQEIGKMGNTGRSTGPHLHWEVRINGKPKDPKEFYK